MSTETCTEAYDNLDSGSEFTCHGTLMYKPSQASNSMDGSFRFHCNSDESDKYTGDDHDCICSLKQDQDINPCTGSKKSIIADCSSDSGKHNCSITWQGTFEYKTPGCTKFLIKNPSKVDCRTYGPNKVLCRKPLHCDASNGKGNAVTCDKTEKTSTQSSSFTRDDVSSTSTKTTNYVTVPSTKSTIFLPGTSTKTTTIVPTTSTETTNIVPTTSTETTNIVPINKARQTSPQGNEDTVVIALGVVAGLAILALIVTLILVFVFRRRKRGRKAPTTNVYMDMNVSDVGSTTYETSTGNKKHRESLENEGPNVRDHQLGVYMDIDDTPIVTSDQTLQQQSGTGTDGIYNSIDEYGPNPDVGYAQANDLQQPSQGTVYPVDKPATSANYFVLEKQEEMSGGSSERLTEDLNPTDNYFVLDKDEDLTDNIHSGIGNANKADTYFILEEQVNEQSPERVPHDKYFLLEKETGQSENTPIDETYNSLNGDRNDDTDAGNDDYSHARGTGSLQESTTRETTVEGNSENYDHLFRKPNNNVVYDADNDYDHMKNDDILTSL